MSRLMDWLQGNKLRTLFITFMYYVLVILPHEWVGLKINKAFSGMSRDQYNLIILILFGSILIALIGLLFRKLLRHPEKNALLFYFGFTIVAMFIVTKYLFVINIECVHYVQYAVGAVLMFALFENYFVAFFIACLVGVFDESYQYFYLAPERTDYFDINDVITNLLGAAMGLLVLKTFQIPQKEETRQVLKKGFVTPLLVFTLTFIALLQTKILSVFPSDDKFMLVRKAQEEFWSTVPPKVTFHVVQPLEGLLIIVALFVVYYFCFAVKTVEKN